MRRALVTMAVCATLLCLGAGGCAGQAYRTAVERAEQSARTYEASGAPAYFQALSLKEAKGISGRWKTSRDGEALLELGEIIATKMKTPVARAVIDDLLGPRDEVLVRSNREYWSWRSKSFVPSNERDAFDPSKAEWRLTVHSEESGPPSRMFESLGLTPMERARGNYWTEATSGGAALAICADVIGETSAQDRATRGNTLFDVAGSGDLISV